jgi:hypothetical protein
MTKLEAMTNDQMTNDSDVASSSFGFCASFDVRHSRFACHAVVARRRVISRRVILMLIFQTCCVALTHAQSPNVIGKWKVEITFANVKQYSLQFDAQGAGKGSLLLLSPGPSMADSAKPAEAKWSQSDQNSVTFSGPVEFPIGNVGRDAGTLVFKGKFETESLITGQVEFSPLVGDGPSKSGTFKATRAAGG